MNLTGLHGRNRCGICRRITNCHWLSINIESSCHLHREHQLYVRLSWRTCESGEAGAGSSAVGVARSRLRYALSRAGERCWLLPKPFRDPVCRPQPSAQSPEEEATRGAEGGRRRREEEGGPNKRVPQRTLAGSNPAWAPFQHRKLPAVRLERAAPGGLLPDSDNAEKKKKKEW